ncbi:hypothetical protein ZWY2020_003137 [Hordeum vulgare]|nr:hypothetical protein ZWY2020_003137 [Hordeum vulgare]
MLVLCTLEDSSHTRKPRRLDKWVHPPTLSRRRSLRPRRSPSSSRRVPLRPRRPPTGLDGASDTVWIPKAFAPPHSASPRSRWSAGRSEGRVAIAAPDPAAPPRILLRGECSTPATTGVPLLPAGLSAAPAQGLPTDQVRPHHPRLEEPHADGTPVDSADTAEPRKSRRIKSVVIAPSSLSLLAISGLDGDWTEVSHRKRRGASPDLLVSRPRPGEMRTDRFRAFNASSPPSSFIALFHGRCFRCLSRRHRLADCQDPVHCILYRRAGHIAKLCPQRHLLSGASSSARSRLGPPPRGQSLHARICFPPPPASTAMSSLLPTMLHHVDP